MSQCDNCNKRRKRKLRPYGQRGGKGWICRMDRCFSPDFWNINKKRQRRKNKEETKEQLLS